MFSSGITPDGPPAAGTWGCLVTFPACSRGPQNTSIRAVPSSTSPAWTRSLKSDHHVLIQQPRLYLTELLHLMRNVSVHWVETGFWVHKDPVSSDWASPERNICISSNERMKKNKSTVFPKLWGSRGQTFSWSRYVQGRASKEGTLGDVVKETVAPTFWVEKLLADDLFEFSFHFQKFPLVFTSRIHGYCSGPKAARIQTIFPWLQLFMPNIYWLLGCRPYTSSISSWYFNRVLFPSFPDSSSNVLLMEVTW